MKVTLFSALFWSPPNLEVNFWLIFSAIRKKTRSSKRLKIFSELHSSNYKLQFDPLFISKILIGAALNEKSCTAVLKTLVI